MKKLSIFFIFLLFNITVFTRPMTIKDFLNIPGYGSGVLSPDANLMVFTKSIKNFDENKNITQLWVKNLKTKKIYQLTKGNKSSYTPHFAKSGNLYFISSRSGSPQLYVNKFDGAEPCKLTNFKQGISGYFISDDESKILILATPEKKEKKDKKQDWIVYDRIENPEEYPQLWLIEKGKEPVMITKPPFYVYYASFSKDLNKIAITYNPRFSSLVDEDQKIGIYDIKTKKFEKIGLPNRHNSYAIFSPDNKKIAFYADRKEERRAYQNMKDIFVLDIKTGKIKNLTEKCQATIGGPMSTPTFPLKWSADSKNIYFVAAYKTTMDLYKVNIKTKKITNITKFKGNLAGITFTGNKGIVKESFLDNPGIYYTINLKNHKMKKIYDLSFLIKDYDMVKPQKITFKAKDGFEYDGFLFLPAEKMEGKYPAIIEMHGGPYYRYGNAWTGRYPWQVFAQHGFAVCIINPRGGTGYGEKALQACYNGFGVKDYEDLMNAVDYLIEKNIIDPERMGFTGYSYGGFSTNNVISRTTRFKAAVSIAGLWNMASAFGQNNPQLLIDSYDRAYNKSLQKLWEDSPASRAAKIKTPTLIIHGLADQAVDPRQAIEMFTYLQLNNVPSRLVLYPNEPHGISIPSHYLDYLTREFEWFKHYLLNDNKAKGACKPLPVE